MNEVYGLLNVKQSTTAPYRAWVMTSLLRPKAE